ncbi:MAG: DUF4351 domain-containing protein [Azospirillum sp.]|nr:DUF4351 domain-containing protein [Azospirillum sp.]
MVAAMPSLIQRHDQFLKRLLDQPGAAGALLRERLPSEVARLLVNEPPELVSGSLVSAELAEFRTDRLYRTRTVTGRPVFVFALIEHKSAPGPRIGLQLLGYQTQIHQRWDAEEGRGPDGALQPLPAVVSLVIYHGDRTWKVPLTFAEAVDADAEIHPYLVDFRYTLLDLGRIDDAGLSREKVLRIGFLILKHGSGSGDLRETLLTLGRAALELGFDDLVTLVRYVLGEPNELEAGILREVLAEIMPGQEERVMSIAAEQWKAEGFSRGLIQGKAEGKAEILLRQLRRRFGAVPPSLESRVKIATGEQLDDWSERFVDARTLSDVFGPEQQ